MRQSIIALSIAFSFLGSAAAVERPTDAQLHAYKAYHHAIYLKATAEDAGGTNKLLHTTQLPTEGKDSIVTPALDHLYTKVVIDLTSGPVVVELPEVDPADRYFSIQVMDQEHYTIYDEIGPSGKYVFVRKGAKMELTDDAKDATVIQSPGDYPHLFVRIQIKNAADRPGCLAVQKKIKLTGVAKTLEFDNPIQFTIDTHDIYPQNKGLLVSVLDYDGEDYKKGTAFVIHRAKTIANNLGAFGPIDSTEPNSNDPEIRAAAIIGHHGLPAEHAIYLPIFVNREGEVLTGDKKEVFTFSYKPNKVSLFWSVTRYSALTRNTLSGKNDIFNAYNTKPDANGNITVTFSSEDPKDGSYWMFVNPAEPYYFVVRYYAPDLDDLPPSPLESSQAIGQGNQIPTSASEVPKPVSGAVMHEEYVKTIGRMAYVWGWPMVNNFNRRAAITQAPEPGRLGGVVPVAPRGRVSMLNDYVLPDQSFVACPNQDVVYGTSYCSLDVEPVVLQVPDFGDRFWIYALYDARTDQFGKLGKPYGTKPGFYLLVGPTWNDEVPQGITAVIRSPTEYCFAGPRIFLNDSDEDRAAMKLLVNQVNGYPLTEFDGQMKNKDWAGVPTFPAPKVEGENKWVVPEDFFDQMPAVMAAVPPLPGEEALYASIKQVLDAAEEDPAIKKMLVDVALETEEKVIGPLFLWKYNGIPAGNGWNRSANNAEWGFDYLMRTGTARSNMYENRPNETQYFYTDGDTKGGQLEGKGLYTVTFAKGELPPVNGFWSLTIYNKHHLFEVNALNRYSLGTKNETLKFNDDGSLTIYASTMSPGKDRESNWLPAPEGEFSLYIRCYWGKEAILDGSWKPPIIEKSQ